MKKNKKAIAVAMSLCMSAGSPIYAADKLNEIDLMGSDRHETACKISEKYFAKGSNKVINESELKGLGLNLRRISGADRIQTSVEIAKEALKEKNTHKIFLVNGYKGIVDSASISGISAKYGIPIVFVGGSDSSFDDAKNLIKEFNIDTFTL